MAGRGDVDGGSGVSTECVPISAGEMWARVSFGCICDEREGYLGISCQQAELL